MTLRVCTVLSAREWEGELVGLARETAAVRLVMRAYQPEDLDGAEGRIDVVVAGAETSWVTPALIASWRRRGMRVVGVHPAGDLPGRELLEVGGADEVFPDDTPAAVLLQAVRLLRLPHPGPVVPEAAGRLVAVTGARGAPGRTEVALTLAWGWASRQRVLLADLDQEAPALAIRLGVPPRPDLADAADEVRAEGRLGERALREVGGLSVLVGSHRPGESLVRPQLEEEVVEAALASFELVVADLGPCVPDHRLLKRADQAVVVAEATAVGLVRAARLVAEWAGPPPVLVLNRADGSQTADLRLAARRWIGLEPTALIAERSAIRRAALAARPPDRSLRRALAGVDVPA